MGYTYEGTISGEDQVWLLVFPRAWFCLLMSEHFLGPQRRGVITA